MKLEVIVMVPNGLVRVFLSKTREGVLKAASDYLRKYHIDEASDPDDEMKDLEGEELYTKFFEMGCNFTIWDHQQVELND